MFDYLLNKQTKRLAKHKKESQIKEEVEKEQKSNLKVFPLGGDNSEYTVFIYEKLEEQE
jgi:hypothetical protein